MRVKYSENTRSDGVFPHERKLNAFLVSLMKEYRLSAIYLLRVYGQADVWGVLAVMPKEEEGTQVPVGALYRRLREVLGRRMRLYCVRRREEENHKGGGHEHE